MVANVVEYRIHVEIDEAIVAIAKGVFEVEDGFPGFAFSGSRYFRAACPVLFRQADDLARCHVNLVDIGAAASCDIMKAGVIDPLRIEGNTRVGDGALPLHGLLSR